VSVTGISISGADSGNYTTNTTASTTANITARPIAVTAATNTKTYDGTTTATALPSITSATLGTGDTANFIEAYTDKNVGTGDRTLAPSGSVNDGTGGNNYTVTLVNLTTGTITAKALTVLGLSASDKIYNGTLIATLAGTAGLQAT